MRLEVEREEDGRWLAETPDLPGVMAYGATREEAVGRVEALSLRVLADRLEHGERRLNLIASLLPREHLAFGQGQASPRGTFLDWLADQAHIELA